MTGILEGIRVLDFGRFIAGPLCATILGDFGADVIRVERVGGSEDRVIVPVTPQGEGAVFLQWARNKRSVTLDTRKPDAIAVLERLIASADVVVASVPPAALTTMGIDYERVCGIKPDIVHCNVSAFGQKGPWHDRGGFDSIGQVMSGAAFLSGEPGQPMRQQTTWVDHSTGLFAAIGVLVALIERARTGRGQQVEASLVGSALAFNATYLLEQALTGINRTPNGNRSLVNGPTDMFRCSDGSIVTQVVGDALFRRWARLVGEPELLEDPRFGSDMLRGENGALLSERMGRWCAVRTCDDAIETLAAAGIPSAPVLSPQAALDHPQIQAMQMFEMSTYPGLDRPLPLARIPIEMGMNPAAITRPPPCAGEHNTEILGGLGFSEEEIAAFRVNGTI